MQEFTTNIDEVYTRYCMEHGDIIDIDSRVPSCHTWMHTVECIALRKVPVHLERRTGSQLSPEAVQDHVIARSTVVLRRFLNSRNGEQKCVETKQNSLRVT